MALAPWPCPPGGLQDGHLHIRRNFLTLLHRLPDPLLAMPGCEDPAEGEKFEVGGDSNRSGL